MQRSTRTVLRQYRDRRLTAAEARRTTSAPSELERTELAAIRVRRRIGVGTLTVVTLALTAAVLGPWATAWFGGARLTGGTLAFGDAGLGALWQDAGSWWVRADLGHATPPDPILTALLPFTAVFGTAGNAAAAILLGSLVASGLGAWFAAGALTRSVWLRAWAAVVWVGSPALLTGIDQVRLGAVLTHIALPWAVLGVARALGVGRIDAVRSGLVGARRTDPTSDPAGVSEETEPADHELADPELADGAVEDVVDRAEPSLAAAAGAGLALCLVTAGTPALLPAVLVALVLVAALRPRRRMWWVALPPLVLHGPMTAAVAADPARWRVVLAAPGVPVVAQAAEPWQQLLGMPTALGGPVPGWVAGASLVLVALLALVTRPPQVFVAWLGWLLAALGLATALVLGAVPITEATGEITAGWTGGAVSLITAGLLVSALVGAGRLRGHLSRTSFGWQHAGAALLVVVVVGAPLALLTAWVVDDSPVRLEASGSVVPAVGAQLQTSDLDARVLMLEVSDSVAYPTLLTGDGQQLTDVSRWVTTGQVTGAVRRPILADPDDATEDLAQVAAELVSGSGDPASQLADLAVGAVLVPPCDIADASERTALVATLDSIVGLERVTETDAGVIWRVRADTDPAADPTGEGTVAWARLVHGTTQDFGALIEPVPASGIRIDTEVTSGEPDRILVLAERADPGWHASMDGVPLRAVETGWRQAFEIGPDPGHLEVSYTPIQRTVWLVVQLPVLLAAVLLAVPVRRRRNR